eukprot:gene5122-5486_t
MISMVETIRSNEMEQLDEDQIYSCRICGGGHCPRAEVIAPCNCSGHRKWVHRSCLDQQRSETGDMEFSRCAHCEQHYQLFFLTNDSEEQKRQRSLKVSAFIARDIGIIIAAIQALIIALSFIVSAFDSHHAFAAGLGMQRVPFLCYYLTATVIFFAIVGAVTSLHLALRGKGGGGCPLDCVGGGPEGMMILLVVLAVFGIFITIFNGITTVNHIIQKHIKKLEKRDLVEVYLVKDLASDAIPITLPESVVDDLEGGYETSNPLLTAASSSTLEPPIVVAVMIGRENDDTHPSAPPMNYLSSSQRAELIRRGLL